MWHAIDTEPRRNGTPGGDNQAADSWNVRLHDDRLPHAVVDVDYFAERTMAEAEGDPPEYGITGMIQFTICTDRDDPGGTETWADISYDNEADPLGYEDLEAADEAARYQADLWIHNAAKFMQWDGTPS